MGDLLCMMMGADRAGIPLVSFASSNGTFVNDCKVGVNKRVSLKNLDRISYYRGKTRFIFIEGEPADNRVRNACQQKAAHMVILVLR